MRRRPMRHIRAPYKGADSTRARALRLYAPYKARAQTRPAPYAPHKHSKADAEADAAVAGAATSATAALYVSGSSPTSPTGPLSPRKPPLRSIPIPHKAKRPPSLTGATALMTAACTLPRTGCRASRDARALYNGGTGCRAFWGGRAAKHKGGTGCRASVSLRCRRPCGGRSRAHAHTGSGRRPGHRLSAQAPGAGSFA
jgi:hypothetical protein